MRCVFPSCFEGFCKVGVVAGGLMRGVGFVRYPFSILYISAPIALPHPFCVTVTVPDCCR
jgi:hypothetical protein